MPVLSTTRMTARQFLQLGEDPPGVRLELVEGEIAVSPSPTPRHSHAVIMLIRILADHIESNDLGELHHDVDTLLDEYNVRRPDILYFSKQRVHLIGERTMEAWRLEQGRYIATGSGRDNETVNLPPFLDLEIPMAKLWRRSSK